MKGDRLYLLHIRDAIASIERFVEAGESAFFDDEKTQWAVIRGLEIIGEASKNLSDGCRVLCPEIPWLQVTGLRNKLIHEYFGVNLEIVWNILKEDLPALKEAVESLLLRL